MEPVTSPAPIRSNRIEASVNAAACVDGTAMKTDSIVTINDAIAVIEVRLKENANNLMSAKNIVRVLRQSQARLSLNLI